MSMTDPIADFLTHIRNALMRKYATVESPASKVKVEIAKVLKDEGYIEDYEILEDKRGLPRIAVHLKYDRTGDPIIRGIQRASRPGLRQHRGYQNMPPVYNGQGISIVTTSRGVMSDLACREHKVGGEVLAHVW